MFSLGKIKQSGTLPYREDGTGLRVLLVTSKETKRWIVPKGYLEPGLSARESAEFEAFEEAGVAGPVARSSIGSYSYRKRRDQGGGMHHVRVFPMKVERTFEDYPEAELREREWMAIDEAIERADDPGLKKLLSRFGRRPPAFE